MQTTIGDFNATTNQVEVTFVGEDGAGTSVTFKREVNACLTNGEYDAEATETRVASVALGVAAKMVLGVIRADQPENDPEPEPATN